MTADIRDRLAGLRIEIAHDAAVVHRGAIAATLRSPSPIPPIRRRRRRMSMIAVVTAVLVVLTAAGALAAESALPGDRLYPVKQATEWVRSRIDPTVPADHRIDELEILIDRRAAHDAIADQLRIAEDAVAEAVTQDAVIDSPLVDRLDGVRDRIPPEPEPEQSDQPPPVAPPEEEPAPEEKPPADRRDRDGGEDGHEDRMTLKERCMKIAASEEPVDVPPWMLRRCRQLLHQSGDRVEGP